MRTELLENVTVRVTGCSELVDFDPDDGGNADAVKALYGDEFLYVPEIGWLHWNGQHWKRDEAALTRAVEDTFIQRRKQAVDCGMEDVVQATKRNNWRIEGVLNLLQSRLYAHIDDFDNDPDMLNVANGVLDLRNGQLIPHESSQRFTYCLPVEYDNTASSELWENFLKQAVTREGEPTNEELLNFLQIALGYSLTGHTSEEKLFYLYGETRAGKGTIQETFLALMPYPLAMGVDFNTFTMRRDADSQNFDLADMKPARAVFASESNKYQSLNPAKIKQLTGGDPVRCAHKHKEFFSYRPQYTPWLLSNHKVNGDPEDNALWGRVLVVELPNSWLNREDTGLKAALKRPEALKGVLNWIVDGAMQWYKSGLKTPEQVKQATTAHRKDLDTVEKWLEDSEINSDSPFYSSVNIYHDYETWCKENGVEPKKQRELGNALSRRGFKNGTQRGKDGKVSRGWFSPKIDEAVTLPVLSDLDLDEDDEPDY